MYVDAIEGLCVNDISFIGQVRQVRLTKENEVVIRKQLFEPKDLAFIGRKI